MNLQQVANAGSFVPARRAGAIDDFSIRHLKTAPEIERILHLRDAIDLSVHSAAGPEFLALEKKETNAALSGLSSWTASSSAPSGSCQWAAGSR